MIITLSGTTIIGRGWDGRPSFGDDPDWKPIADLLSQAKARKVGTGYRKSINVTPDQARLIKNDLIANAELYEFETDAESRKWARAFRKDAEKIGDPGGPALTAWDVAGDPDLFSRVFKFSARGPEWECMGVTSNNNVAFSRLVPGAVFPQLRQITRYVKPETPVILVE